MNAIVEDPGRGPFAPLGETQELSAPAREEMELSGLLRTVWRRKWLVMATVVLVTIPTVFYVRDIVAEYSAKALVMIESRSQAIIDVRAVIAGLPGDGATVRGEMEVLRSRSLARETVARLNLFEDPEFNPALRVDEPEPLMARIVAAVQPLLDLIRSEVETPPIERPLSEEELMTKEEALVVDTFLDHLDLVQKEETRVISVAFRSEKPQTAALAVNTLVELYTRGQRETKFEATREASVWLNKRVSEVREQVRAAEAAVEDFRRQSGLVEGRYDGVTVESQQVSELSTALIEAQAARAEAGARWRRIEKLVAEGAGASAVQDPLTSPMIGLLFQRKVGLELEIAELGRKYTDNHPEFGRLNLELADVEKQIQSEVRATANRLSEEYNVARAREASLQKSLDALSAQVSDSNASKVGLRDLEREAEASRALLKTLLARLKETKSQEDIAVQSADARIISLADVPNEAEPTHRKLMLAIALFGSAFLGMLLAFLKEQLQPGFLSGDQVLRATGVRVLGLVPRLGRFAAFRSSPVAYLLRHPGSAFTEAIRSFNTNLFLSGGGAPPKTVLFTSAEPREGKTTTAVCLARMRALAGQKVIIVDADVRRPGVHSAVRVSRQPGLVELLNGEASIDQVKHRDKRSGADVIPAGGRHALLLNPPTLFASERMDALLEELAKSYDFVIVDSPPLMAVSDALVLATKVERTIFVLRWARTNREVVKVALGQIVATQGAAAVSALLTMVDLKRNARYGYGESGFFTGRASKYYNNRSFWAAKPKPARSSRRERKQPADTAMRLKSTSA